MSTPKIVLKWVSVNIVNTLPPADSLGPEAVNESTYASPTDDYSIWRKFEEKSSSSTSIRQYMKERNIS